MLGKGNGVHNVIMNNTTQFQSKFNDNDIFSKKYSFLVKKYELINPKMFIEKQINKKLKNVFESVENKEALIFFIKKLQDLRNESEKKYNYHFIRSQILDLLKIIDENRERIKTIDDLILSLDLEEKINVLLKNKGDDIRGNILMRDESIIENKLVSNIVIFNDESIFYNNTNFFKKNYYIKNAETGDLLEINKTLKNICNSFNRKNFSSFMDNLRTLKFLLEKYKELEKLVEKIDIIFETIVKEDIRTISILDQKCNRNKFHIPLKNNMNPSEKNQTSGNNLTILSVKEDKLGTEDSNLDESNKNVSIEKLLLDLKNEYENQIIMAVEESTKNNKFEKIILELLEIIRINYGKHGEKRLIKSLKLIKDLDFLSSIKELVLKEEKLENIEKEILDKID